MSSWFGSRPAATVLASVARTKSTDIESFLITLFTPKKKAIMSHHVNFDDQICHCYLVAMDLLSLFWKIIWRSLCYLGHLRKSRTCFAMRIASFWRQKLFRIWKAGVSRVESIAVHLRRLVLKVSSWFGLRSASVAWAMKTSGLSKSLSKRRRMLAVVIGITPSTPVWWDLISPGLVTKNSRTGFCLKRSKASAYWRLR